MTLGEELEMLYGRIATIEAELATERKKRGRLSGLVITAHMACFPSYLYTDDQTSLELLTAGVTTLRTELATERARLDHLIQESNKGEGWLQDHVWDEAAELCPLDSKEADDVCKWVRAVIDKHMKGTQR